MNLINLQNITMSFTERKLLNDVSLGINEGDRIGLIGINGTGKSTLLRIVAGQIEPETGTVTKGKNVRIAYLPQTPEFTDTMSLLENVVRELVHPDSYRDIKGEAAAMLAKLSIENVQEKPSIFSGGQRKRAALVRALLMPADVLLLDEPTNHLDAAMTEWLSEYLQKNAKALVMITHDRYFLDAVTNKIVELSRGALYTYRENYTGYLLLKAERESMVAATERKARSLYRTELAWMMRGARARSTKQKAHIERFTELQNRDKIVMDASVEISAGRTRLGSKTIEVSKLSKSYGDTVCVQDFSYIFLSTDRIGIIGPNGCGKSTFVKLLTGRLEPDSGVIECGTTVKIGYFCQENELLPLDCRVIDYVRSVAEFIETSEGTITASKLCERFLFTDEMQYSMIAKLSGGEKRRLALLHVLMEAPNVLILDEPTNDLDITTLSILEDYLQSFQGIILAVSHDRYFLDRVVNRIFSFEGNGVIKRYEGNYADYRAKREQEEETMTVSGNARTEERSPSATNEPTRERKLRFSYQEKREYESIDETIEKLEQELKTLEEGIADAASDYGRLQELMARKESTEQALSEKMERWVYLTELAEQIEQQ